MMTVIEALTGIIVFLLVVMFVAALVVRFL